MFNKNQVKEYKMNFNNKSLVIEIGKMCQLSNASCLVKYGDTTVLVNATMANKSKEDIDFIPLSVDFEERLYSVGKIPGSFLKREGRPTENAILASRLIDRSVRPLFPKNMKNEVTITITVMSVDFDHSPEIAGLIGASVALSISDIPWNGPIGAVNVGLINGEIVVNPSEKESLNSKMRLTVSASSEKIIMIEANADQITESTILEGIKIAHKEIKELVKFISDIKCDIGKEKIVIDTIDIEQDMFDEINKFAGEDIKSALDNVDKNIRDQRLLTITESIHQKFDEIYEEKEYLIDRCISRIQRRIIRAWLIDDHKRIDGRKMDEMRPLSAEVDIIPRVHGSGMFTRGDTQVLSIATLGIMRDAQTLDGIDGEESKRYIHHYNFPSFSVGETKISKGPGRREIGHGALAEKALEPVIPSINEFPYTIRVVSEVLSSNGSTSQASICGSTLALMQAGVPITSPVAGISCGLVTKDNDWVTVIDIQGLEDFFGDMDFKVAGTHNGITAIQMDIKIDGLTYDIIEEVLEKTKKSRIYILDEVILKTISKPRDKVSKYALQVATTKVDIDKIGDIIGPGGKIIQKICSENNVKIDVDSNGQVFVYGSINKNVNYALLLIEAIAQKIVIGSIFKAKVVKTTPFGAFVEYAPGKEGLVHISKLDTERVEHTEDIVNVGDVILVKVIDVDKQGRVILSKKDAIESQIDMISDETE